VEPSKNRITLIAGVATAGVVTAAALTMAAWPALTRPDPPSEASGDDGLRIRLVQPPKAMVASVAPSAGPLEVGLSEAAQAMAKGREAFLARPTSETLRRSRRAPVQVAEADDVLPPLDPVDDQWRREAARRDQLEQAQRRHWEEEALAREARDERSAWERERRRWDAQRDRERDEDRYPLPPAEDGPEPERW